MNKLFFYFFNFILFFNFFDSGILIKDLNPSTILRTNQISKQLSPKYLKSNNLDDYILDTGDTIEIYFENATDFTGIHNVDKKGNIYLPNIKNTYVRGLNIEELEILLNNVYSEYIKFPDISVRVISFKPITVSISGEIQNPGKYAFRDEELDIDSSQENSNILISSEYRSNYKENDITLTRIIFKAGGLTSFSNVKDIEISRKISLSKGGGRKLIKVDISKIIDDGDFLTDMTIYNNDKIKIFKLNEKNEDLLSKAIIRGINPKFLNVSIFGEINTRGEIKVPAEATLSDLLDITGPKKPLSGNVKLIRYGNNGNLITQNIKYIEKAKRGSKNNPFLKQNDILTVQDSILSKSAEIIKVITQPAIGIYTTKKLIEDF